MARADKQGDRGDVADGSATRRTNQARCPMCGSENARIFPMVGISLVRYACGSCGRSCLTSR